MDGYVKKNNGNIYTVKRGDSVPDEYKSSITPKYTFEKGKLKDWSDAGIQRFNELREMVVENRKIYSKFDDDFVKHQREELVHKAKRLESQEQKASMEANNDLEFSETEDEDNLFMLGKHHVEQSDTENEDEEEEEGEEEEAPEANDNQKARGKHGRVNLSYEDVN